MGDIILIDMIEAWLHGPLQRLGLRFPNALEARFEADTGPGRSRLLMYVCAAGLVGIVAAYPALLSACPDMAGQFRLFYLGLLPALLATSLLMRFNPHPILRETVMMAVNTIAICAALVLFAQSRAPQAPVFVAAIAGLMVYCAVGIQLRFPYAVMAMVMIVLTYIAALEMQPDLGRINCETLELLATCMGCVLLIANRRLERDQRRLYLFGLKDALQREDAARRTLELDELTRRDPLTGLANRRAYDAWLSTAWAEESARDGQVGLILVDIDKFRDYNDFCGQDAGDNCLKKIAVCLRDQLRGTSDRIARLSGGEFAVLLPGLREEVCADIAERLRLAVHRLELPHLGLGLRGLLTVSAGVASHKVTREALPSSLYQSADAALYQAKVFGRNRVCIASPATAPIYGAPVAG